MSVHVTEDQLRRAQELVAETRANGGLAPIDLEQFWADQAKARKDVWAADCPQLPLGIGMSSECVWTELGIAEDWYRLTHDRAFCVELNRQYNDISEKIVGRRLLGETPPSGAPGWPAVKELHDIFEGKNVWHDWSYWLQQAADSPDELEALLDRVEARLEDLRAFLLPPEWDERKADLLAAGSKPPRYRGQRGPITFACSIFGPENLIFLMMDQPDLAARFRDLILKAILGRARILDEEAGFTPETAPHGWGWADDNCCLLNLEMYEFFGAPILKGVFDTYCPGPNDSRFQHSDSDMAHLLPAFAKLGLNGTNFGPNVMVDEIRAHLPKAVIQGQLAPFTFSRHEEVNMVAETIRDFEYSREQRGVLYTTAGSINNGSRLTGLRLIMSAIQRYCRY